MSLCVILLHNALMCHCQRDQVRSTLAQGISSFTQQQLRAWTAGCQCTVSPESTYRCSPMDARAKTHAHTTHLGNAAAALIVAVRWSLSPALRGKCVRSSCHTIAGGRPWSRQLCCGYSQHYVIMDEPHDMAKQSERVSTLRAHTHTHTPLYALCNEFCVGLR